MHFTKMHGLGNDYLYVYGEPADAEALSIKLSDRHFGAGSDGMIWISPSEKADFSMRIFNADGSEAMMCGNGIRCLGKYVYDKGYTDKKHLLIDTCSGIKTLDLSTCCGKVKSVSVDMGKAVVGEERSLSAAGRQVTYVPVSVGNPHAVIFIGEDAGAAYDMDPEGGVTDELLRTLGPAIEKHEDFPEGVNVEFISVTGPNELRMRVWERGSGVTMACGTGSCASAAAAVSRGIFSPGEDIAVTLDGGVLKIRVDAEGEVTMTGPAAFVYEGETID